MRLLVCFAAAGLLGASFNAGLSQDAPGASSVIAHGLVSVTTSVGDIKVRTWSNQNVRWVTHKHATSLADLARLRVDVSKDAGNLSLSAIPFTGCERCDVDLEVWVPRSVSVTASGAHGDISVSGVGTTVIARTSKGDVQIGAGDGDIVAATQVGDVQVRLAGVSATHRIALSTVIGDVALGLPRGSGSTLMASTDVGTISSAFGAPTTHALGQSLATKAGDGVISIKLSTHTGDIDVSAL